MAVTLKAGDLAVILRAAPDAENVDARILTVVNLALAAASQCVVDYAPDAPDAIHNAAVARLAGWMYDAEPADPQTAQALRVSGAQALLSMYREHRAGVIGSIPDSPEPSPAPAGSGLPDFPPEGSFILQVVNGELQWLKFPAPAP